MTGLDLIKSSMRLIGALAAGENPDASEANDGLMVLNQMLDSWSVDRLMIYSVTRQGPFNLIPGQQNYYLGPGAPVGGQLMTTRPIRIERVGIIHLGNPIQPLEIPIDYMEVDNWADIPVKNIQGALPLRVFDDKGFPYRTFQYWVVPTIACQTVIYAWVPLSQFPDLTTDMVFPPAYLKALRYNLAVDLGPELMGADAPASIITQAKEAKAEISNMNAPNLDLKCDAMLVNPKGGRYNWITDTPARR